MSHTLHTHDQNFLFGNALIEYDERGMPINAPHDWKMAYAANNNDMLPIVNFEFEDE